MEQSDSPTVLIVDDEKLTCDLLEKILKRAGYQVITTTSGYEGLTLFRSHRPEFTILDLRMRQGDLQGIQLLEQIRKVDQQAAVMVLTGWGGDGLEAQARKLGVRDFLSKRMTFDALMDSMERGLEELAESPTQQALAEEGAAVLSGKPAGESILVVDDEPQIRDLLLEYLTRRGYRVRTAPNGPEALALVGQESPALIILDVYMPGMNGVEVLRQLRETGYTSRIILLTGSQDQKLLGEAFALGEVEVMGKPLELDRLALVIRLGMQIKNR